MVWSRRHVLAMGGAAVVWPLLAGPARALQLTPSATAGPFYPDLLPLDRDADLTLVDGADGPAPGTILDLTGRVIFPDGSPIAGAAVEIWQCDAQGFYHHSGDRGGRADPRFQGFGETQSRDDGAWRFRTIRPVPYPGRTPHIHFAVRPRGQRHLITQMYVAGDPGNAGDWLYRRLGSAASRVSVDLKAKGDGLTGHFDIVLDG